MSTSYGDKSWSLSERDFPGGGYLTNALQNYRCSLQRLLLATGVAMSPSNGINSIEAYYAILRYSNIFTNGLSLRIKEEIHKLDSHKKAIFSDELGFGACICILGDIYNIRFIADADYFILKTITDPQSPYSNLSLRGRGIYGDNGKMHPDFFCIADDRTAVIAEAKGTFGVFSNVEGPLKKGKNQVRNVRPRGIALRSTASQLVIATQIPYENINSRSNPHSVILDPEENNPLDIDINEVEIMKHSIAKTLVFSGFGEIAQSILLNKSIEYFIENLLENRVSIGDRDYYLLYGFENGWYYAYSDDAVDLLKNFENSSYSESIIAPRIYSTKQSIDTYNIKMLSMGFGLVHIPGSLNSYL